MRRISLGFSVLALAAFGVTDAQAASTAVVQGATITVTGDEAVNDITFDGGWAGADVPYSSEISDTTGISAGAGCTQTSATRVRCGDAATVTDLQIYGLGGADEVATSTGASLVLRTLVVDGGTGNDHIAIGGMSTGPDNNLVPMIRGGAGNDRVYAGGDSAVVDGGEGDDLMEGTTGADLLNGEAGADQLNGNPGNDKINGGDGNDNIQGGGGDDEINGGAGEDTLSGDAGNTTNQGNDLIEARDGQRDTISCDFGADIANVDEIDVVESDMCETVNVAEAGPGGDDAPQVSVRRPSSIRIAKLLSSGVPVRLVTNEPVGAAVALFVDGATARRLGIGRKQVVLGKKTGTLTSSRTFTVRVAARFRRAVSRSRGFTLQVLVVARDADDNEVRGLKKIRVRR